MDLQLTRIIDDAQKIQASCAHTLGDVRQVFVSLSLTGRRPQFSRAIDIAQYGIGKNGHLDRLITQSIQSIQKKLLQEFLVLTKKIGSLQDNHGLSDEDIESLLVSAFENFYGRHLDTLERRLHDMTLSFRNDAQCSGLSATYGFSANATNVLETAFQRKDTLNNAECVALSQMSGITPHQVRTWFQNRRNRARKNARKASATKTHQPPPPPPPSSAATTDSSRPLSALPRRGKALPTSSFLPVPDEKLEKTTPDATGTGRRIRAMPKRAFPPIGQKPKNLKSAFAYSSLKLETMDDSPAPSMARSLSAHSSDGSLSSVDPSGGFNSLLNPPIDVPPQVSIPDWGFDFNVPDHADFGFQGMELDMGMFGFGEVGVEMPLQQLNLEVGGLAGMGGMGMERARSDGQGGLGGMGGLNLGGMPIMPVYPPMDKTVPVEGALPAGQVGSNGDQGQSEQDDGLDWLSFLHWDDEEPANVIEEIEAGIEEGKGKGMGVNVDMKLEVDMDQQEMTVSPGDISPSRSHSGCSSRSLTPPPLPQTAHFNHTSHQGDITHISPSDPLQAIDHGSHSIPPQVPQHQLHPYPAQYAYLDGHDSPSRIPSYGSVSSTASTRIITPPSAAYYTPLTNQHQGNAAFHPSQGDIVSKHHRTESGEGLTKSSSWTAAPSLDQVAERSTQEPAEGNQGQPIYRLDSYYPLRNNENAHAHPTLAAPPGMAYPALFSGSGQALHPQDPNLYFHPARPSYPNHSAYPAHYRPYFPTQPTTCTNPTPIRPQLNMTIPISSSRSTDIPHPSGSSSPPTQSAHSSPVPDQGKVQLQAQVLEGERVGGEWISGVLAFEGTYNGEWDWQNQV